MRLIASQAEALAAFYEAAFGFVRTADTSIEGPSFAKLMGVPGARARVVTLRLGEQEIELVGIHPGGRSFAAVAGWSPLFAHCAIVVSDMAAAYARLCAQPGWTAISKGGPQVLPPSSGGVTAFKFRDPENHPLELLAFPPGAAPPLWQNRSTTGAFGIDHAAISVADTARSVAFYARLGLSRIGGSLNIGPEQDRLDAVANAHVEVTALAPEGDPTPHIELLCYRGAYDRSGPRAEVNDVAASELVLAVKNSTALQTLCEQNRPAWVSGPVVCADGRTRALLRDPDGHWLCLEAE